MILAPAGDGLRLVTQPEHAALAGALVERWGGDGFAPPDPLPAVRLAVHAHDDGWLPEDRRPTTAADGTPRNFHELPDERWLRRYRRGIDEVTRADRYAGLLVSLHGSGLRRRRYGLSPGWGDTPPAFADFVREEERRQRSLARAMRADPDDDRVSDDDIRLLDALHETGEPPGGSADECGGESGGGTDSENGGRLWFNYRLLQALDALSLRICGTPSAEPSAAESKSSEATEPITVDRVPTAPGGPETTLVAELVEAGRVDETPPTGAVLAFRLDPFPFTGDAVRTTIRMRLLDRTTFADDRALGEAYHAADTAPLTVLLVPGEKNG